MAVYDDKVFIAGDFRDDSKGETDEDKNWKSIFATCISFQNGNTLWAKGYKLSRYNEKIYGAAWWRDHLYITGVQSSFYKTAAPERNNLGNALIAKIDPVTGNLVSYKTFGTDKRRSIIFQPVFQGDFCLGFGNQRLNAGKSKGLLIKLNSHSI